MSQSSDTATQGALPAHATLDAWVERPWNDGLQLEAVQPLASLDVRTTNTGYRLTVIDGGLGDVLITGGRFFPTPTRVRVNGATLGGSLLKCRGIYRGFRLELQLGRQVIVTTRVQSVSAAPIGTADEPVH